MFRTMRHSMAATLIAAVALAVVVFPRALAARGLGSSAQSDGGNASEAQSKLDKKQFKDVKVSVDNNGIATLSGTVDLYEYKVDADKRVHKIKSIKGVRNEIEVGGPSVPDQELQQKLQEKLMYDRVGYGTNAFNAIGVKVQNGAVTLGGHAYSDVDKDSALALVSTFPGVKDVTDEIEVDPTSIMDNQIRLSVARAIYGYPSLNKYAINPARPIRISVQNGNVELYGTVDSNADRDTANIRANGVPGVFSVKNYLQVAGQPSGQEKSQK
jgi:hyperosmotically inducible periplasmic protein